MENWSTSGDGLSLVIGCVSASAPFGGIPVSPFKAFCKGRRCQQHEAEQFAEEDRVCVVGTGSTRFALIVWKPEIIFETRHRVCSTEFLRGDRNPWSREAISSLLRHALAFQRPTIV